MGAEDAAHLLRIIVDRVFFSANDRGSAVIHSLNNRANESIPLQVANRKFMSHSSTVPG